jgi:hypothetical protein
MRLPRMTTRRWTIAVAVVGLILWEGGLSAIYRNKARQYEAEVFAGTPKGRRGSRQGWPRIDHPPSARLQWAKEMARKYEYAALHPWLPLAPDPPPPM